MNFAFFQDQYNNFVVSDGRITEINGSSDTAVVSVKKTDKPKQKALEWDHQTGDSQVNTTVGTEYETHPV